MDEAASSLLRKGKDLKKKRKEEALLDRFSETYVAPEWREVAQNALAKVRGGLESKNVTLAVLGPSVEVFMVADFCPILGKELDVVGVLITMRRYDGEPGRPSAPLLRAMLEGCGLMMMITNMQGEVEQCNMLGEELTRLPKSEIIGKSVYERFVEPPTIPTKECEDASKSQENQDQKGSLESAITACLAGETPRMIDVTLSGRDRLNPTKGAPGTPMLLSCSPRYDNMGRVTGCFLTGLDITKRISEEHSRLREEKNKALKADATAHVLQRELDAKVKYVAPDEVASLSERLEDKAKETEVKH